MSITRVRSGLIFDDNFDTLDTRWVVSPSDSYIHSDTDKRLTLVHNPTDRSTNALFQLPQDEEELLLQVQADYIPTHLGDEGGIVIWKNALEKVEFLESEDTNQTGEYSIWRAIKRQNLWTFFAQKNDAWELFDSTICINPTMAGVVLKGVERTNYAPINMDRVILCRGSNITVGNLTGGCKVTLVDATDMSIVNESIVPDNHSGVSIELPSIPFRGKVEVYELDSSTGNYVLRDDHKDYAVMYGGDAFMRGTDLKVFWKGKELSEITPTHLGALKDDEIEYKMTVLNNTIDSVAENVEISIAVYNQDFGWEWCDLANDVNGNPGLYQDLSVTIGTLLAGESKDFWVKITKKDLTPEQEAKQKMRPSHFYLNVRNQ
ncbi:hypothetical protein [Metabacillus fastidiosus]|uniref:hypothetical protein n=1 Tax=Metabacillus fastidiosus TaxID=1458 RepID=UPI003D271B14